MLSPVKRSKPQQDHTGQAPTPETATFRVIGHIRSPYTERFGTPRQAQVTDQVLGDRAMEARIELVDDAQLALGLKGIQGFDYIWVVAWLHLNTTWGPLVMPPRGPREKQGVFATRSPNRPNAIGLSALRLQRVEGRVLHVLGIDLLDGTPVLDIKPYVPYADAFPGARTGWLTASGESMTGPDLFEPAG
jgi:tRNA-Thr(GGU) m(6)t(6)A37 methyltransferase TsaA